MYKTIECVCSSYDSAKIQMLLTNHCFRKKQQLAMEKTCGILKCGRGTFTHMKNCFFFFQVKVMGIHTAIVVLTWPSILLEMKK